MQTRGLRRPGKTVVGLDQTSDFACQRVITAKDDAHESRTQRHCKLVYRFAPEARYGRLELRSDLVNYLCTVHHSSR